MGDETLKILASGATAKAIEQGCAAAQRVFDADGWEIKSFPEDQPSRETFRHAEVWEAAEAAARDALCADGTNYFDFEMTVIA